MHDVRSQPDEEAVATHRCCRRDPVVRDGADRAADRVQHDRFDTSDDEENGK